MSPGREPLPPRSPRLIRQPLPRDASALPALPEVFHRTLRDGVAALGLELSRAQLDGLDVYVRLLISWTEAINLTAIREPEAVARDHLLDSLSAVASLQDGVERIADLGSGGGLPGIPLAIALPDVRIVLVESVAKKAAFLQAAIEAIGIGDRASVVAERAESLASPNRDRGQFDAVVVRAVGPLRELIELGFPLLRVGGRLIAWKRQRDPADLEAGREPLRTELAAGQNAARALGGTVADARSNVVPGLEDHRLIVVSKHRPTPMRFPRSPAERRAQPL